jgi:high-affinity iron transporter
MRSLPAALAISLSLTACSGGEGDLPPAYRRLEVPEARLLSPEARSRGRALFLAHCAICHGEAADGHGLRAEGFSRPPAAFTDPAWRRRTSPRRAFYVVREGVRGTPMPSWKSLEEEEVWDLVAYVLSVGYAAHPGAAPSRTDAAGTGG